MDQQALVELDTKWGKKYPIVLKSWLDNRDKLSTYFSYTPPFEDSFTQPILLKATISNYAKRSHRIPLRRHRLMLNDHVATKIFLCYCTLVTSYIYTFGLMRKKLS